MNTMIRSYVPILKRANLCIVILISAVLCNSCSLVSEALDIKLQDYQTGNIYSTLDMSTFKGFTDKQSINDLTKVHGEPDTILNVEEVAATDGYNIWEYKFSDGAIDCYIKKNDTIVDYLFFEPSSEFIKYTDFIKRKSLVDSISNEKAFASFIIDSQRNTVRIRNTKDKKGILNIALNDNEELESDETLAQLITGIQESCPLQLSDFGVISNIYYKNKELTVECNVNELSDKDVSSLFFGDKLSNAIGMMMWGNRGFLCPATPQLMKERPKVCLSFKGNRSNKIEKRDFKIGETLTWPTTNLRMLQANMDFNNIANSPLTSETLKFITPEPLRIEDGNFIIGHTVRDERAKRFGSITDDQFQKFAEYTLSDPENPDWTMTELAYKCGLGIIYKLHIGDNGRELSAYFNNRQILTLISAPFHRVNNNRQSSN